MNENNRYIPILSDYGFKVTFANQSDTLFLRKSLQAAIQSTTPIRAVKFGRNEVEGFTKSSRSGLYDLICVDEEGQSFIVEMQVGRYKYFMQRLMFYVFHRYDTQVRKGKYFFDDLKRIYGIGFLTENIYEDEEYYHFGMLKNQRNEIMDDKIVYVIVELRKFNKKLEEIDSDLDKLIYTMKHLHTSDGITVPPFWGEDWLNKAIDFLDKANMEPEQKSIYEMMVARNVAVDQQIQEEKKAFAKEYAKEVLKESKAKTKKILELKKQAEETEKKLAKRLLERGESIEFILEITTLSRNEIENL